MLKSNNREIPIHMTKHIAIFIPAMKGGGIAGSMVNLSKNLAENDYVIDFVLPEKRGPFLKKLDDGANVIDLKCKSSIWLALPKLIRYIKEVKPDAVMSSPERASVILAIVKKRLGNRFRSIIRIDSTTSIDLPKNKAWKTRNIFPFLIRRYYGCSDEIVAVSDGVARDLYDNFGVKCTRRIYNGIISEDIFRQAEEPINEDFFAQDDKVILSAGRLAEQKNYNLLIDAFSRIPHKGYKLVILGEGGERESLTAQVKKLGLTGEVIMPGFVSNPYKFMARSSLFVLSSDWEGLANVLIEALALGLPVVSTDCPHGPMEILKDGKFGHLVPTGDVEALASAMLQSLEGDKRIPQLSDLKEFTVEESTRQYMKLFDSQ